MPSALEIAGSAHRATSPAFKLHAALACVQIALVTWICRAADIWRSKRTSGQFPGHLGLGLHRGDRRQRADGGVAVADAGRDRGQALDVGRRLLRRRRGRGSVARGRAPPERAQTLFATRAARVDVALRLLFGIGLPPGVSRARRARGWPGRARVVRERVCLRRPLCFDQYAIAATRSRTQVGLVHLGAQAAEQLRRGDARLHVDLFAMGALLRVFGERNQPPREAGACYAFAAYRHFLGGQMGLTLTAEASHVDVGAYVVIWHIALLLAAGHVRLLLAGWRTARRRGYFRRRGAVRTPDDRPRPGRSCSDHASESPIGAARACTFGLYTHCRISWDRHERAAPRRPLRVVVDETPGPSSRRRATPNRREATARRHHAVAFLRRRVVVDVAVLRRRVIRFWWAAGSSRFSMSWAFGTEYLVPRSGRAP